MKRFNIVVPKKYTHNGEEKTQWNTVGTLVRFEEKVGNDGQTMPESFLIEMSLFPHIKFKVFEQKPREEQKQQPKSKGELASDDLEYPTEHINPEDIPF